MTSPDSPDTGPGATEPGEADAGPGQVEAAEAALRRNGGELQADVTSGGEPDDSLAGSDTATQPESGQPSEGDKGHLV